MSILAVSAAAKAGKDVTSLLVKQMFTEALTPETIEMLLEDPDRLVGAFGSPAVVRKFFANQDFQDSFFKQTPAYRNRAVGTLIGTPTEGPYDTIDQVGGDHRVIAAMVRLNPADYLDWAALVADPVALEEITATTPRLLQHSAQAMDSIAGSTSAIGQIAGTQAGREFLLEDVNMRPRILTENAAGVVALTDEALLTTTGLDYILADTGFMDEVRKDAEQTDKVNNEVKLRNNVDTWSAWVADAEQFDTVFADPVKFAEVLEIPEALHAISADAAAMEKVAGNQGYLDNLFASADKMDIVATHLAAREAFEASELAGNSHTDMSFGKHVIGSLGRTDITPDDVPDWPYVSNDSALFGMVTDSGPAMDAVASSRTAMDQVAASQSAMNSIVGKQSALDRVTTTKLAMDSITASQLAMDTFVGHQGALNSVVSAAAARDAVTTSQLAMDTVAASQLAMNTSVASLAMRDAVVVSQVAMDSVAASQVAMDTSVASQAMMDSIVTSTLAMNTVAASSLARTTIGFDGLAYDTIAVSNMAIGKLTAGHAGLAPSSYADMTAVAAEQAAMDAVVAAQLAMDSVVASQLAMDSVVASQLAMDTVVASQMAMDAVVAAQLAMDSVVASQLAMDSVVASQLAMDTVVASQMAMDAVAASQVALNSLFGNFTARTSVYESKVASDTLLASTFAVDWMNTNVATRKTTTATNSYASLTNKRSLLLSIDFTSISGSYPGAARYFFEGSSTREYTSSGVNVINERVNTLQVMSRGGGTASNSTDAHSNYVVMEA